MSVLMSTVNTLPNSLEMETTNITSAPTATQSSTVALSNNSTFIPPSTDGEQGFINDDKQLTQHLLASYDFTLFDFRTNQILRILQWLCVFVSGSGCIYFLCIGYLFIALEYFQVCFISSVVLILDNTPGIIQRIAFVITIIVAIGWGITYFLTNTTDVPSQLSIVASIIASVMPFTFLSGVFFITLVITEISSPNIMKCVELDLILYLVSLTAICFFSVNSFNNNLHMILDIRLMVMLYSGLYQEKDKMKLLRIPSFLINMIFIIISFLFFAIGFPITHILGNVIYILIGSIFLYEGRKNWINPTRKAVDN